MGAWGAGIFDDDTAYDVVDELNAAASPRKVFEWAFALGGESKRLGYDECHAVTVCSAYVDMLLHGTTYRVDAYEENIAPFLKRHRALKVSDLRPQAVDALRRVLGPNSELNELWASNEGLYLEWKSNIGEVISRLLT